MFRNKELHHRKSRRAFTLVEVLCVIVIISILAAMILAIAGYAKKRALTVRAISQMKEIDGMIIEYKTSNGRIPPSLSNIVSSLSAGFSYSNGLPLDPWNGTYQYIVSGDSYRLFSMGPDMATGNATNTGDDIL